MCYHIIIYILYIVFAYCFLLTTIVIGAGKRSKLVGGTDIIPGTDIKTGGLGLLRIIIINGTDIKAGGWYAGRTLYQGRT